MVKNDRIEKDLHRPLFFLHPRLWSDFFFFFFFRCLYAVVFDFVYIKLHHLHLTVNKKLFLKEATKETLFVGDSTISFPVQENAFPYLFFENGHAGNMHIVAKPGLNSGGLVQYILQTLSEEKKYNTIFVACFLNEIIHSYRNPDVFEKDSLELFALLRTKLKPEGKIIYIYGDFSLHPVVPNNYFKKYFHYKTEKYLSILKNRAPDVHLTMLMNFGEEESSKKIRSYFYKDGLHFSEKGQKRLYRDLVEDLKEVI